MKSHEFKKKKKSGEVCIKAVEEVPYILKHIPDRFKTQGMCIKAFEKNPWMLKIVPAQEMCTTAVHMEPYS